MIDWFIEHGHNFHTWTDHHRVQTLTWLQIFTVCWRRVNTVASSHFLIITSCKKWMQLLTELNVLTLYHKVMDALIIAKGGSTKYENMSLFLVRHCILALCQFIRKVLKKNTSNEQEIIHTCSVCYSFQVLSLSSNLIFSLCKTCTEHVQLYRLSC